MTIDIEVDSATLRQLVLAHIREMMGSVPLDEKAVKIEVISRNNYRAKEWEVGDFRARISVTTK